MKLLKNLFITTLMTTIVLLMACGDGESVLNDFGNSSVNGYKEPILPTSKGADPFDGLTSNLVSSTGQRYVVNTEKKTLTVQMPLI